ncbi:MAG: alpha-amylase [Chloroflexi bacterium]|nr:alpha-amylase [Chloroflexota bacterium]
MEDFIFGTVATDELKLLNHRAAQEGLQHMHRLSPAIPQPGMPVTLTVVTGPDQPAERMAAYLTTDGREPRGGRGAAETGIAVPFAPGRVTWSTLLWGYLQEWHADLPAQPDGTLVRYKISAWCERGSETYADWPESKTRIELATDAWFKGQPWPDTKPGDPARGKVFSYIVGKAKAPAWAHSSVIYQVFVDRFHPGQGRAWLPARDLHDRHGGTLWGVAEKLDHIQRLGADALWLSPTWPSPSHHGYDVTDYERTNPRLGGDEALRALLAEAHRRGIRVILDLVCNHISNHHPIFAEALANHASPYRGWFTFDDSPVGYRSFFGTHHMPQVNLEHPGARQWMLDVAQFWLREFDVDGYRLDHANGPSPDFWPEFTAACLEAKPDAFVFGEVVEPPDVQKAYEGRLHGLLDFHLCDHLRKAYGYRSLPEEQFETFLQRHRAYFPDDDEFVMLTFVDNHDMDRFRFIAGGDTARLKKAAAVQFAQPGTPVIYYGTELGLSQQVSIKDVKQFDASRAPMVWDEAAQDLELFEFYQGLVAGRVGKRS